MVAADDRTVIGFMLSAGNDHDAPQDCKLLEAIELPGGTNLLMDRAYQDDKPRSLAASKGLIPVVPPKSNRKEPWDYDRVEYKKRNEIERLFARIKRFRRVFTRFEKADIMFIAFILIALIYDSLICVNMPYIKYEK